MKLNHSSLLSILGAAQLQPEWLNNPGPYVQYTHNPTWKMLRLLELYPFFFDDQYWYWRPKAKTSSSIVKRSPLWTYPCKSISAEKAARKKAQSVKAQTKLIFSKQP